MLKKSLYDEGLGAADVQSYYRVAHLAVIVFWESSLPSDPAFAFERWAMGDKHFFHYHYGVRPPEDLPPATRKVLEIWPKALKELG